MSGSEAAASPDMKSRLIVFLTLGILSIAGGAPDAGVVAARQARAPRDFPVLVLVDASNPFGRYYVEILRAEGLNHVAVLDISQVTASTLESHDVVLLGHMPLTEPQVEMLTEWVSAGGNLVAMRPDPRLAGLLGLGDPTATISDGYLLIDTSSGPGVGLVAQSIQFHGSADCLPLRGARAIATLYLGTSLASLCPAVTLMPVGTDGGHAAAFAFDLARSIVYTRQGNPAWSGQERDGIPPIRSDDLFVGRSDTHPAADWLDTGRIAIPGADEQQRLLANMIITMSLGRTPLPRFWYFPRGHKAVVVMTGDDHGVGATAGRFDDYRAKSPADCSVADWECVRSTSFIYPSTPLTDAQAAAYTADGFEVALHVNTGCLDWTADSLETSYADQIASWTSRFPSLPAPATSRTHCVVWSDYTTQAEVELRHGIRLDTNYYHYPAAWVADRPGFFTGSGMPMRFARADGTTVDVYQAATQMTDESGQSYPATVEALLDLALGPEGYYGVFTANIHTDQAASAASDAIIAAARARGVPVVSARQMLTWLDERDGSSFTALSMRGSTLSFTVVSPAGKSRSTAGRLQALLPIEAAAGTLSGLTFRGRPLAYTTQTIKGITYAAFGAGPGDYTATYTAGAHALPGTSALEPTTVIPGGEAFTLRVTGSGFVPGSVVRWNGADRPTTFASTGRLDAEIPASDVATGASVAITVFSPRPGGGVSNALTLRVANPLPAIARLDPDGVAEGSGDIRLAIDGAGFVPGSVARWNGEDRPTEYVSSRALAARIGASDLATAGTARIAVHNAPPGGGSSAPVDFAVRSPKALLVDDFSSPLADGWAVSPFSPLRRASGWSVVNHVYRYDGGGHTQSARGDVSWSDYAFEVGVRLTALEGYPGGIRGRFNPMTGAGYAVWQYPASGRIVLYRVPRWSIDDAGRTELGAAEKVAFDTGFHRLRLVFRGASISVYRDGKLIISATDETYATGLVAFDVSNQVVEFDNVLVTDLRSRN